MLLNLLANLNDKLDETDRLRTYKIHSSSYNLKCNSPGVPYEINLKKILRLVGLKSQVAPKHNSPHNT